MKVSGMQDGSSIASADGACRPAPLAQEYSWARQSLYRLLAPLHSFRIQTALIFGGLTVMACAAAALALGSMMTSEIQHASARSLRNIAQTSANTLAAGLADRLLATKVMADSTELWSGGLDSPTVRHALARAQAAQPYNAWIGVADAKGKVVSSTGDLLLGQSVVQRPWFGEGLRHLHVGDVHRALLLERLLPKEPGDEPIRFVDFAAPIQVDGKTVGVIGMHGTWGWAREVVTSLMPADAAQRGLEVYIFDRAGKLLYAPDDSSRRAPNLSLDDLTPTLKPAGPQSPAAEVVAWPDGQTYLTTVAYLPFRSAVSDMGWQIVAREPVIKAFARAQSLSRRAFGIGIVLAAVAGWLAWLASGVLSRPLVRLADAARRVQDRSAGATIPVLGANREVRSLSTALVDMTSCLEATYRTAPVGMCQIDIDGKVLSANDRLADVLDMRHESLRHRQLVELIAADDRSLFAGDLRDLAQRRLASTSRELCIRRDRGDVLTVALSASMVPAMNGAAAYFIVVVEDVSQRIAAEAADRASAAKSTFLSQVSHELRTPLNAVLGFSQLMQMDPADVLSDKQRGRVDAIAGAGKHLLAMISDLLDLTQIEGQGVTLSLQPLPVSEIIDQSLAFVTEAARSDGVTIEIEPPSADANWVLADQIRLRQVLVNLLSNAVKYNRRGGKVTVSWCAVAAGQCIELTITDTGRGIHSDRIAQLFQPFNRLGAEASGIQGTGIGLVITRKLVELMQGEMRVVSSVGSGSRFSVLLPIAEPLTMTRDAHRPGAAPAARAIESADCRTVLYVEDNEVNIELLASVFELTPHLRLLVARSGEEALAMLTRCVPDVILMDMHLGDMSGIELAARLKQLPASAAIPVIALSADAMRNTVESATGAGFSAYLTKPVNLPELFACLDAAAPPTLRARGEQEIVSAFG